MFTKFLNMLRNCCCKKTEQAQPAPAEQVREAQEQQPAEKEEKQQENNGEK